MSFVVNLVQMSLLHSHPLYVADRGRESLVGGARCVVRGVASLAVVQQGTSLRGAISRSRCAQGKHARTAGVPSSRSRNGTISPEP